ncbi:hypothetical protein H6A07_04345 [Olsenella uli]|uniref:hypothetical protein n=1 Tax=Olsenella uli TaxID=133926 RepID=UPI001958CD8F|nr:hypothetical protein [Olsenella uli]MBM6675975.1 hypothetical protein [Olsenella uli]
MLGERICGAEAPYLRRLGTLSGLLCGAAALLGMLLVALQPTLENVVALLVCAGLSGAGALVARDN